MWAIADRTVTHLHGPKHPTHGMGVSPNGSWLAVAEVRFARLTGHV